MANDQGVKKRVERVLEAAKEGEPMTMGQIMDAAGIVKTHASDVSSALYKLRNEGLVRSIRGQATSSKGPRFVRKYQWIVKTVAKKPEPVGVVVSPMAGLGVFRI